MFKAVAQAEAGLSQPWAVPLAQAWFLKSLSPFKAEP